jgi:signal peptidase II
VSPAAHPLRDPAAANRWLVPTALGAAVLAADQLTKAWAVRALGPAPGTVVQPVVGDWLNFVYGRNTGIAFGLLQDLPGLFTVTSILITAGAIYAYAAHLPNRSPWVQVGAGLLLGGAIGNIVDRLRLGYVVDFIQVGWFPLFNIADSAISTGVAILAAYLIFVGDEPAPAHRAPPRDDGLLRDLLSRDPD